MLIAGDQIGYALDYLEMLNNAAADSEGPAPGEALFSKLPKDREGNLKNHIPTFKTSIEQGIDTERALVLALLNDMQILIKALKRIKTERGNYRRRLLAIEKSTQAFCKEIEEHVNTGKNGN